MKLQHTQAMPIYGEDFSFILLFFILILVVQHIYGCGIQIIDMDTIDMV